MGLNRAMITFGDKQAVLNIDSFRKVNDYNTIITLTDGSMLYMHPFDVNFYDRNSEMMKDVEDSLSPIHIDDNTDLVEDHTFDRAIIQRDDKLVILNIAGATSKNESSLTLLLADGTEFMTHPRNAKIYNSKSPVMKQVEDGIVMFEHQRILMKPKPITRSL